MVAKRKSGLSLWRAIYWLFVITFLVALGCVPFLLLAPAAGGLGGLLSCAILNLLTGICLVAWFGWRGDPPAALRVVFYAFTAPVWFFLVWAARDLWRLILSLRG